MSRNRAGLRVVGPGRRPHSPTAPRPGPEPVLCPNAACRRAIGERTGPIVVCEIGGQLFLNPEAVVCGRCRATWSNPYRRALAPVI